MTLSSIHLDLSLLVLLGIFLFQSTRRYYNFIYPLSRALLYPIIFFTTFLVFRTAGLDVENYFDIYNDPSIMGWDYGFALLNKAIKNIFHLDFSYYLLFLFFIEILFIIKISKKIGVDYLIVLSIYMLHLAVVRDLSQLRIGLAIGIILYGLFCLKGFYKILFILLAGSIHITSIIIIPFFIISYLIEKKDNSYLKFASVIFILSPFLISILILNFESLNERIAIYINWQADGYGNKVESFSPILFQVLLLLIALINFKIVPSNFNRIAIFSFVYSSSIFLAFSDYQIFASRLSNVAISLYPYTIAFSLSYIRAFSNIDTRQLKKSCYKFLLRTLIFFTLILIIFRPGNDLIIDAIVPKISFY